MMKLNSIIYLLPVPLAQPIPRPALSFAGFMRTVANLSAKGFPLGTYHPAAFCGVTAHHLDTLRTAWRELMASVPMIRPACWRWGGAGAGQKSGERTPETDRLA